MRVFVTRRRLKQVVARSGVGEAHIEVGPVAGQVCKWLGHEYGQQTHLGSNFFGHKAKKRVAVAGGQGIGIAEVELELRMAVFMIE